MSAGSAAQKSAEMQAAGKQARPRALTTALDALIMLRAAAIALAACQDEETGQQGIEPHGVEGLWWQEAMQRGSEAVEAAEETKAGAALRELVEATFALAGAKGDDGESEGVYQMGVEGLHFGSAYAAAQAILGLSDETVARAGARPAHIELPRLKEAAVGGPHG